MREVQISYLIEHPEYIPQLAQWLFEQWGSALGEETPEDLGLSRGFLMGQSLLSSQAVNSELRSLFASYQWGHRLDDMEGLPAAGGPTHRD